MSPNWRLKLVAEPPALTASPPNDCCWELFQCTADARRGRGLRATRDIAVHELIFRERSLLIAPTISAGREVCAVCFQLASVECPLCRCGLLLCDNDEQCVRRHSWECAAIRAWTKKPEDTTAAPNQQLLAILPAIRSLRLNDDEALLLSAMQANDMSSAKRRCVVSDAMALFDEPPPAETIARLRRTVAVLDTNAFETVIGGQSASVATSRSVRLCGLFALGGQLNHACTPNTRHAARINVEDGGTIEMSVYASHAIRRGDEITSTYTSLVWDRTARRTHLWLTKRFWCECERCCGAAADRVDAGLAALRCRTCATGRLVPPALQTDCMRSAAGEMATWTCEVCCTRMDYAKVCQTQQIAGGIVSRMVSDGAVCQQLATHPILQRLVCAGNALTVEAMLRVIWSGEHS